MDQTSIHREFVRRHFEAVNRRDVQTVLGICDRTFMIMNCKATTRMIFRKVRRGFRF